MQQIQISKEINSKITSKGQITLPIEVRKHLGVDYNDQVTFLIESSGEVKVQSLKYPTIESLAGAAGSLKKPLSFKKMRQIAREERLVKKYGHKTHS